MSTQIRIGLEVKEQLEQVRDRELRVKTHSDAIEQLMADRRKDREYIKDLKGEAIAEKERKGIEDLTIGEKRKDTLIELQKSLGLRNPIDLIDLLLEHYHNAPQLDKSTFLFYAELRR